MGEDITKDARRLLEGGELSAFTIFVEDHRHECNMSTTFPDDEDISFLMILVQTYRKMEATRTERAPMPVEEYLDCFRMLVRFGANINHQDELSRTVCHWAVLLQAQELLGEALALGCDPSLQDVEGQTIVHLSVRLGCQTSLETIKCHAPSSTVFEEPSECSGATPLIYAVQIGGPDTVKKLVQLSVDVNTAESNKYKRTALHYALFTNRLDIFEVLLKAGAKPNIPDYNRKTVLERVAKFPNEQYLRLTALYSSGEVFTTNREEASEKTTPLMGACQSGDTATVEQLLNKGIDPLAVDEDARTALHHCAEHRDTSCAKKLIEQKTDLTNEKDRNGFTTLHLATISGNAPLMTLLLDNGADVDCLDNEGHTCMHWAVVCGQLEAIDLLIRQEASLSIADVFGAYPLHYATQSFVNPDGDLKGPSVIHRLLHNNAPVDCMDKEARTPLLWAASLGVAECCQFLLEAGASLQHQDKAGLTALHCAASRGQFDVVDLLLDKWQMDVDCTDKNGCTALFYAVTLKQTHIVELLLNRNSNPNHQDKRGRSPAHCAALKGYVDILSLLRSSGGSLWLRNEKSAYPLHESCESGNAEVVCFLIDKATDDGETEKVSDTNREGYTCLHLAAEANSAPICEQLLNAGLDVNAITPPPGGSADNRLSKTPLDLTSDPDCQAVLKSHGGLRAVDLLSAANGSGGDAESEVNTEDFVSVSDAENEPPPGKTAQPEIHREGSVKSGYSTDSKSLPESLQGSPLKRPKTAAKSLVKPPPATAPGAVDSSRVTTTTTRKVQLDLRRTAGNQALQKSANQSEIGLPKIAIRQKPKKIQPPPRIGQPPSSLAQKKRPIPRSPGRYREMAAGPAESYYALPPMTSRESCGSDTSSASFGSRNGGGGRPGVAAKGSVLNRKSDIARQIADSVRQFESVRSTMREMARMKRMQIYHGYLTDKGMMDALRNEYQRNYLYMQEFDSVVVSDSPANGAGGTVSKSNSSSEITAADSPVNAETRQQEERAADEEAEGITAAASTEEDEKEKLETKLRETRDLYERVQRQSDETLRQARRINAALCEDLQKKRIAAYTSKKSLRRGDFRPITASMSEAERQDRVRKAYASPLPTDLNNINNNNPSQKAASRPKTTASNAHTAAAPVSK